MILEDLLCFLFSIFIDKSELTTFKHVTTNYSLQHEPWSCVSLNHTRHQCWLCCTSFYLMRCKCEQQAENCVSAELLWNFPCCNKFEQWQHFSGYLVASWLLLNEQHPCAVCVRKLFEHVKIKVPLMFVVRTTALVLMWNVRIQEGFFIKQTGMEDHLKIYLMRISDRYFYSKS